MEEEKIQYPFYETAYLDDDNIKHIAYIKKEAFGFYKDRFTILDSKWKEH